MIGMICLTGGCASSPPVQFYTLGVVPAERRMGALDAPVQIGAVHLPSVLDRQEMVRERGPNQLELSNEHRWGAPLADMTRRVLTQDLQDRLPASMVVLPEQPAPPHTRVIVIDILKFESESSGHVVLQGSWSLVSTGSDTPSSSRPMQIDEHAPAQDYAAQAQAMSRAVGQLADSIADALKPSAVVR
jgi:hypothetical protein